MFDDDDEPLGEDDEDDDDKDKVSNILVLFIISSLHPTLKNSFDGECNKVNLISHYSIHGIVVMFLVQQYFTVSGREKESKRKTTGNSRSYSDCSEFYRIHCVIRRKHKKVSLSSNSTGLKCFTHKNISFNWTK